LRRKHPETIDKTSLVYPQGFDRFNRLFFQEENRLSLKKRLLIIYYYFYQ